MVVFSNAYTSLGDTVASQTQQIQIPNPEVETGWWAERKQAAGK